jgi:molybdopterin synthase catalytic subunit
MAEAGIHRKGEIDLTKLVENVRKKSGKELGAIACFVGVVREKSKKGGPVKCLHYEAAGESKTTLLEIATQTEKKPGILHVQIHHVIDDLRPGEDAIYVVVGAKHRKEAFKVLSEIMDRVKKEPMIWKKEVTKKGGNWV